MPEFSDIVESATWRFLNLTWPDRCRHEPNGHSTFPDFCIGDSIAVECTRLVKNVVIEGGVINVTQVTHPLRKSLEDAMFRLGSMGSEQTYFVCLDVDMLAYNNPGAARDEFVEFLRSTDPNTCLYPRVENLACGLGVSFIASSTFLDRKFELGTWCDPEGSGWVVADMTVQILNAIQRKTEHAKRSKAAFKEYYLAVGSGLTSRVLRATDTAEIRQAVAAHEIWSALILVNTLTPDKSDLIRLECP